MINISIYYVVKMNNLCNASHQEAWIKLVLII